MFRYVLLLYMHDLVTVICRTLRVYENRVYLKVLTVFASSAHVDKNDGCRTKHLQI